jgi:prepilin-type N-terminal cleavage/methylation domain-containing protein
MRPLKNQLTRRGFTLIELLVVIGIIGLLVSILVPALVAARESANRAVCLSNLHTLSEALVMYSQVNRGCLPNDDLPGGDWWEYNSGDIAMVNFHKEFIKVPRTFWCPSDVNIAPTDIVTAQFTVANSARTSYDFYSLYWPYEYPPLLTKMHSQAPLAWDVDGGIKRGTSQFRNHKAHAGNVVYADTHGEWIPAELWEDTSEPPKFNFYYP